MITAALNGELKDVSYDTHTVFGLAMPTSCPNVPTEVLNPKNTWKSAKAYDVQAKDLATSFHENFAKFKKFASSEIMAGGPLE
jgi:phosphoenolpyruvate carboxykinase (ATP)